MLMALAIGLAGAFILAENADGLVVVDQHAAHERLVYERMKAQMAEGAVTRQALLTPEVVDWIIEVTCKDRSYGARPLRRAIQRYVEDPLSEELIRGHLHGGDIEVYLEAGALAYRPLGEVVTGRRLA